MYFLFHELCNAWTSYVAACWTKSRPGVRSSTILCSAAAISFSILLFFSCVESIYQRFHWKICGYFDIICANGVYQSCKEPSNYATTPTVHAQVLYSCIYTSINFFSFNKLAKLVAFYLVCSQFSVMHTEKWGSLINSLRDMGLGAECAPFKQQYIIIL